MIKRIERDAIIQSLKMGVVPRLGLKHIQVGRKDEISAVIEDIKRIEDGAAIARFVVGPYGSGKSFFLNLCKSVGHERKLVVAQADITPERRLHATQGQARNLFSELMQNLSTRSRPDGGALESIIEKWISEVEEECRQNGNANVAARIRVKLRPLQTFVGGFDFATVVEKYFDAHAVSDHNAKLNALKWLTAQYGTKTEARQDLGVRSIINDDSFYSYLKLYSLFFRAAGYSGLLVNLDEMVVLSHRLNNSITRNSNYEAILTILNDCLQGNAQGIGFLFGGTPEFITDERRGLYSYEALKSRLAENQYANERYRDYSSPVLRLSQLTQEELFILLSNIKNVFQHGNEGRVLITDDGIKQFMSDCYRKIGAEYFLRTRDITKRFASLLSMLEQYPENSAEDFLDQVELEESSDSSVDSTDDDELATFHLK